MLHATCYMLQTCVLLLCMYVFLSTSFYDMKQNIFISNNVWIVQCMCIVQATHLALHPVHVFYRVSGNCYWYLGSTGFEAKRFEYNVVIFDI